MTKLQLRTTRIYIWLFFILVLLIPLCLGTVLIFRLDSDTFQNNIISAVASQLTPSLEHEIDPQPIQLLVRNIQVILGVILGFVLTGSLLALVFFYRYLILPLQQMALTAHRIVEGNLDISMPRSSCSEVDKLGRSFNDLSVNLQEVILLVWNYLQDSSPLLDRMIRDEPFQAQEKMSPAMRQDLMALREEMKTIEQVITSFTLYDVRIIEQRAMAGSNTCPGRVHNADEATTFSHEPDNNRSN